jgi:two-component sensor histidine kinase
MVLTELVQNAVEHAYPAPGTGGIDVEAQREDDVLIVHVLDEGAGLPPEFSLEGSARLGLRIVRTLVEGELRGSLALEPRVRQGTRAVLRVPLPGQPVG